MAGKRPELYQRMLDEIAEYLAARLADVPLGIVRGISNIAGDRDKTRWKIVDALNSAADAAMDLLK